MSTPSSSTSSASCLTNLLERHEAPYQCPCWCHNGYSPPCYDCAEVVCHKKTHELSSQGTTPSAPPLTFDLAVPNPVQDIIDNRSAINSNNNSDDISANNNTWLCMNENDGHIQRPHRSDLRLYHPRSAGTSSSPLSCSWTQSSGSSRSNRRTSMDRMWPGSIDRLSNVGRPALRFSYSKANRMGRTVSMNSLSSLDSTNGSSNIGILNSTMRWQGGRFSDFLLPTAIGTTARDTVSPDAAKWPLSRYTVYPGAVASTLSPSIVCGNANFPRDSDDHESVVPSRGTNAVETADTPDEDLPNSFQMASEGAGSLCNSGRGLPSSLCPQPYVGNSDNEMSSEIVGIPSLRVGDVGTEAREEVEKGNSVFSSEARGQRLIEETLYPTEISGRTKPFLLWKLNL